eukprot:CAMPEP_0194697680 /NCGR_PEP_ID=MMETSP0295-20121207/23580_1 /TAXON_ID=39354 /ORGANISM="Heterosigma akashiwo, Strain CCMP2393" /LENGTH=91 /DNA_ID=CAMNT_0039590417 /DNA_START=154 /DNA_END=425 /DNA_ORIENTATION=-
MPIKVDLMQNTFAIGMVTVVELAAASTFVFVFEGLERKHILVLALKATQQALQNFRAALQHQHIFIGYHQIIVFEIKIGNAAPGPPSAARR